MIRFIAMPEWRWIAGPSKGAEALLQEIADSLDVYFGGGPLTLGVHAALVTADA